MRIPTNQKRIGLVDCNNFFVSCERLFRPDLLHRRTIVLSSNDGCVVARSGEAKEIGIPMGVPLFKITNEVKQYDIAVLSGNLTLYRDISRRVFEVVRRNVDVVEQYSVDEAFLLLSGTDQEIKSRMQQLRDQIHMEVGIPVSIGVAFSKTQAKVTTDIAKKQSGVYVLSRDNWSDIASKTKIGSVWGIGSSFEKRLREKGVATIGQFIDVDPAVVQQLYGVVGARTQQELQGVAVYEVGRKRPLQKSLMSSRSFKKSSGELSVIEDALAYHVRHIAAELRSMQAVASVLRVSLHTSRFGDFLLRGGGREVSMTQGTSDTFALLHEATKLLEEIYEHDVSYTKVGVTVAGITPEGSHSVSLFAEEGDETEQKETASLLDIIDSINIGADKELIKIGGTGRQADWQSKSEKRSSAYTTRWADLKEVQAK